VRELVQRHYETYGRELASSEQAHAHTKILIARLGHLRLGQLGRREQERFVADLRERSYASSYISDVLSTLRRAVNLAVEREELAGPVRVVSVKRTRARVAPVLTVEQLAALWAAAEGSFHGTMYLVLALGTAARPAAILDLTRDRVREDLGTVQLLPHGREQNHKRRPTVPLTEPVRLWARLVPEGHLVHVGGHPLQRVRSTFAGIRARAGLPAAVSPYSLRRSVATHLKRLGVPVDDIAALLGHSAGNRTTELYAEVGDFLPRVKEGIEELLNEIGRVGARPILPTVAANPPRQRRCP
jgi:integrase